MLFSNIKNIYFIITILIPIGIVSGPAISDWLICLSGLLFLLIVFKEKKFIYFNNIPFKIFLIWSIYIILLSLFSKAPYHSLESSLFYFRFAIYALSIWYLLDNYKVFKKYFFLVFLFVFFFIIIDSFIQLLFSYDLFGFPDMDSKGNKRLSSVFGEEFVLGSFVSRLLPVLIGLIYLNKINKKIETKLIIILILCSITIVFLSGERSAFFYSIISTLMILFFVIEGKLVKFLTIILSLFSILIISSNFMHSKDRIFNLTLKQINFFGNSESNGIEFNDLKIFSIQHEVIYETSFKIFKDNKLFGIGPKMFRIICDNEKYYTFTKLDGSINGCQTHPHNTYIQLLTETGLIGSMPIFLLFLFVSFVLTKYIIFFKMTKSNIIKFYLCMIIALFISLWPFIPTGNFFNNWLNSIYFMPLGFIMYFHYSKKNIIKSDI